MPTIAGLLAAAPLEPGTDLIHVGALPRLTKRDRCDRCVAQALVAVRLRASGLRLHLCGHHYAAHEPALAVLVDAVRDQRGDAGELREES